MISTLVGDPVLCMVGVSAGTAAGPRNASSSSTPIVPPASRSIARNSFLPEQEPESEGGSNTLKDGTALTDLS